VAAGVQYCSGACGRAVSCTHVVTCACMRTCCRRARGCLTLCCVSLLMLCVACQHWARLTAGSCAISTLASATVARLTLAPSALHAHSATASCHPITVSPA
jgi:hypothetical protein